MSDARLAEPPAAVATDPTSMTSRLLSTTNLRKTYRLGRVDVPVLKGATLHVQRGEWVAVLGPSGSGKSTLLHLLGDLDQPDPDGGTVAFDGRQLPQMSLAQRNRYRNRRIGFVFQFYHLLPELNVVDNVLLSVYVHAARWPRWSLIAGGLAAAIGATILGGVAIRLPLKLNWIVFAELAWWQIMLYALLVLSLAVAGAALGAGVWAFLFTEIRYLVLRLGPRQRRMRERAGEVLQSFGLAHRLNHRPRELSGGERQRVAIARALMNDPQILLADEPTGNLDEKTGEEILDLIAEQHGRGLTIVMVTHDPAIARRADRIVQLHDGRVTDG